MDRWVHLADLQGHRRTGVTGIERRQLLSGAAAAAAGVVLLPGGSAAAAPTEALLKTDARCGTPGGRDFPKGGGNLGNQNYSGLDGIHRGNLRKLGAAWVNRIEGGITTGTNQSTAVAVDGVLYIESAFGHVHAVDGVTGVTRWKYT